MLLDDCLKTLIYYNKTNDANPEISSITMDSRKVREGCLFFCITGTKFDGHMFAKDAEAAGAGAIVAEKAVEIENDEIPIIYVKDARRALAMAADNFYGRPSCALKLTGITGTNGKTSMTHIIRSLHEAAGLTTGLIGTMGVKFKDKTLEVNNTTPESVDIQRYLAEMRDCGTKAAVMEVSSHALHQGRVRGLDFDIALFTNLTQDHLDYHQTMQAYLNAKSLLFSQLGNTYNEAANAKLAIINEDDEAADYLKQVTSVNVVTYGLGDAADYRAADIDITAEGTSFKLHHPDGASVLVKSGLIGRFNVYNLLGAIIVARHHGLPLDVIIEACKTVRGIEGRFEPVDEGQDFSVLVDYSHTPDSLENALKTIRELAKGKVITVVGCGGDRDRSKRPLMAGVAVKYSDQTILTSDNPRSETPGRIIEDMESGISDKSNYTCLENRKEAIDEAIKQAETGDVILIAGKGHETYQIIGDEVIDFDDREIARAAIKELN